MRHSTRLLTPVRALHRALLLELAGTTSRSNGISSIGLAFPHTPQNHTSPSTSTSTPKPARTLGTTTAPCPRTRAFSTSPSHWSGMDKLPRDYDIPHQWVRIADESGTLSAPQRLETAVEGLETGYSLVMVAPPPPPGPREERVLAEPSAAVCRVVDTAREAAAREAAVKEAERQAQRTKTLELNWSIADHDLGHRLKRLDAFLAKGLRVEIMLARKRGSRKATPEEAAALVDRVRDAALGVPGTFEYKKMSGKVGGVVNMFFEAPEVNKKKKGAKE